MAGLKLLLPQLIHSPGGQDAAALLLSELVGLVATGYWLIKVECATHYFKVSIDQRPYHHNKKVKKITLDLTPEKQWFFFLSKILIFYLIFNLLKTDILCE